jgi:hypothetical protein
MMYECIYCIKKIDAKRVAYGHQTLKKKIIFCSRRRDNVVPAVGDTGLPRGLCPRHGGRIPGIRHIHRYERRRPVLHAGQQIQPTSVADPGQGSGDFLTLDPDPGSGIGFFRIPDPNSYFLELSDKFLGKKFYNSLKTGPNFFLLH